MNNNQFSVVFDGQKVPDSELFGVKQRLKDVFNADRERIETLFSGKPVAIKRNLSREDALKYQHMLKKMGITVTLVEVGITTREEASIPQGTTLPQFSLAPLGADLIAETKSEIQNRPELFRTHYLDLAPQKGALLNADERKKVPSVALTGQYDGWELSTMGEDLLKQSEKQIWQEASVDTSELAFMDAQAPLSPPTKKVDNDINTEHLSLLPLLPTEETKR